MSASGQASKSLVAKIEKVARLLTAKVSGVTMKYFAAPQRKFRDLQQMFTLQTGGHSNSSATLARNVHPSMATGFSHEEIRTVNPIVGAA